jgi:hypothetical protein
MLLAPPTRITTRTGSLCNNLVMKTTAPSIKQGVPNVPRKQKAKQREGRVLRERTKINERLIYILRPTMVACAVKPELDVKFAASVPKITH